MWGKKERVAAVSALASGSLAAAKFVVGIAVGSLALISDALHSLIDLGATLVTWYAVRVSDRPPDAEHHYGHGKVENLAALVATALLFLLAGGVTVEAVQRLLQGGDPPTFSFIPFVVLGIEMVVNGWRARVLHKTARETNSAALEADSLHFTSDLLGSIAVIIGLALSGAGYFWGDSAAALAVAAVISLLGVRLGRRTIETLIDTAPQGVADTARSIILATHGVVRVDRLRVRTVGHCHFVDVAIAVPRTMPLDRLASLKQRLQDAVTSAIGEADVTITTTPVALDNETVQDRIMVIARNRGIAVHHLTVHAIGNKLAVAVDVEVDGSLPLGRAHEIATGLEEAVVGRRSRSKPISSRCRRAACAAATRRRRGSPSCAPRSPNSRPIIRFSATSMTCGCGRRRRENSSSSIARSTLCTPSWTSTSRSTNSKAICGGVSPASAA